MSRILVIDDSELIVQLLEEFLVSHGYEVVIARDATAGYEAAISQAPDLILLDVKLPDVTGFELLRTLRNRTELRRVPVIMLTATAQSSAEKVQGFQQGADDYVLKPFNNDELLERIRIQLRKKAEMQPVDPPSVAATAPAPAPLDIKPDSFPIPMTSWLPDLLVSPTTVSPTAIQGGAGAFFTLSSLLLLPLSLFFAAADVSRLVNVTLGVSVVWLLLTAALVISSSFFGLSLRWGHAFRLMALAGVPIILKLACAALFSIGTTLSPYYFSAGPMLVMTDLPAVWARIDLFEIWSLFLLGLLLSRLPRSARSTAAILCGIVFILGILITFLAAQFGKAG